MRWNDLNKVFRKKLITTLSHQASETSSLTYASSSMSMATTPEGSITLAAKRRYTRKQLTGQCDLRAAALLNIGAWDNMPALGRERVKWLCLIAVTACA